MKQWDTYPTDLLEFPEDIFPGNAENDLHIEKMEMQGLFRTKGSFYSPVNKRTTSSSPAELPVNNYLKTRDEIEAEFRFVASSHKEELMEKELPTASYGRIVKIAEAYSYLHTIDQALAAPLEENY